MQVSALQESGAAEQRQGLTIRGAGTRMDSVEVDHHEPVASTSAVTLDSTTASDVAEPTYADAGSAVPVKPWALAKYGIPAPDASIPVDPAVEAKLRHFHTLRSQGVYFNASLQSNKSFRNPSILSKLVSFVNVDEKLSAFPPDVWSSSSGVASDAWAERIAEQQKQRSEEREKAQERGKRSAIDFTGAVPKERISLASGKEESKRSSRWDSGKAAHDNRSTSKRHDDRDRHRYRERDRSRSPDRRR